MKELEQLNLTESDFKMITDGLECLPSKDMPGEILFGLLEAAMSKDDPAAREKLKQDRSSGAKEKERAKQLLIEDVRILQGKLLTLQRFLRMNGLLKQG